MDFYDKLKSFLFGPRQRDSQVIPNDERPTLTPWSRSTIESDDDKEFPFGDRRGFGFNVFSDPLEMHKFFEQQRNEMLKAFGFSEFGSPGLDNFTLDDFGVPSSELWQQKDEAGPSSDNLREHFLKPGYKNAIEEGKDNEKIDKDIDGQVDTRNFGSMFGEGRSEFGATPWQRPRFFGQGSISRCFTSSNGSSETHSVVTDNEGNEETTITRRLDDKEYTVIKRKDKDGKTEVIENFINMNKEDVKKYFPETLFDKFFK